MVLGGWTIFAGEKSVFPLILFVMENWIDVLLVVLVTAGVLILLYVAARSKSRRTADTLNDVSGVQMAASDRKQRAKGGKSFLDTLFSVQDIIVHWNFISDVRNIRRNTEKKK